MMAMPKVIISKETPPFLLSKTTISRAYNAFRGAPN